MPQLALPTGRSAIRSRQQARVSKRRGRVWPPAEKSHFGWPNKNNAALPPARNALALARNARFNPIDINIHAQTHSAPVSCSIKLRPEGVFCTRLLYKRPLFSAHVRSRKFKARKLLFVRLNMTIVYRYLRL